MSLAPYVIVGPILNVLVLIAIGFKTNYLVSLELALMIIVLLAV